MQIRHIGGIIESRWPSAEEIPQGRIVRLNADSKWIKAGDGEYGSGIATQHVRQIGTVTGAIDIYASSYDEGLPGEYSGRRNVLKVTFANVGDPLGVLQGAGNVVEWIGIPGFLGILVPEDLLTSGPSGEFKKTTNRDVAIARVTSGGDASVAGSEISILTI
jgi:hypothetical protein